MKKSLLICLCIAALNLASAQDKIRVFVPESNISPKSKQYTWAIKTDPVAFIMGELPLIAEVKVLPFLSIEASAGATRFIIPFDLNDVNARMNKVNESSKWSTAFRTGLKFYPNVRTNALEGTALGIQAFLRTDKRGYTIFQDLLGDKEYLRKRTGIALTFTTKVIKKHRLLGEFYMAAGVAQAEIQDYQVNHQLNGPSILTTMHSNKIKPDFQLGWRGGFAGRWKKEEKVSTKE